MDFKKISIITLLMFFSTIPAQAEQPMANEYRQMLQSGTYYLEYSIRDYDFNKRLPVALQQKKKPGMDDDKEITSNLEFQTNQDSMSNSDSPEIKSKLEDKTIALINFISCSYIFIKFGKA